MLLWLGGLSRSQDQVWCCGEGDVVKSNKWLTIVKIQHVVGCVNGNFISLVEDWM